MNSIVTAVRCDTLKFNKDLIFLWCFDFVRGTRIAIRGTGLVSAAPVASTSRVSVNCSGFSSA